MTVVLVMLLCVIVVSVLVCGYGTLSGGSLKGKYLKFVVVEIRKLGCV